MAKRKVNGVDPLNDEVRQSLEDAGMTVHDIGDDDEAPVPAARA